MTIRYSLMVLLLMATPALAGPTRSDGGIDLECKVTGSSNDGYDFIGTNNTQTSKSCTATCRHTKGDGSTGEWELKATNIGTNKQKYWLDGKAGLRGGPFKNPDLTRVSCR